jgi:hypothetical protein
MAVAFLSKICPVFAVDNSIVINSHNCGMLFAFVIDEIVQGDWCRYSVQENIIWGVRHLEHHEKFHKKGIFATL